MKYLFATNNQGKIKEVQAIVDSIKLLSLKDFPILEGMDPEETGETFAENALIKAATFGRKAEIMTIAEDSGLVVDAMAGGPGIKSARWVEGTDRDRNMALLKKLENVDEKDRGAKFVSTVCLYNPHTEQHHFFYGEIKGKIGYEEKGDNGFGYDPIFIPENYDKSFAELGSEVKNSLSHRLRAMKKLEEWLEKNE